MLHVTCLITQQFYSDNSLNHLLTTMSSNTLNHTDIYTSLDVIPLKLILLDIKNTFVPLKLPFKFRKSKEYQYIIFKDDPYCRNARY